METQRKPEIVKYLIYVGICAFTVLFMYLFMRPRSTETLTQDPSLIPPAEVFTDKNGNQAALMKQYVSSLENSKMLIDSLSRALKIKPKQIKGVDRVVIDLDTVWKDSVIYVPYKVESDSTVISRKDAYIDILAVGKKKGSYIRLDITPDTLSRVEIRKNQFLRPPRTEIVLRHSNPYMNTTQGSSFVVENRKPWFSIGISAGYDVINNKISLGPTVTVPIKTFYRK